jgi:hypothetical protein
MKEIFTGEMYLENMYTQLKYGFLLVLYYCNAKDDRTSCCPVKGANLSLCLFNHCAMKIYGQI